MNSLIELLVFGFVVIGALKLMLMFKVGDGGVPAVVHRPLMTQRETAFWHLLRRAADPWHVAPQVGMNALLNAEAGLDPSRRRAVRNRFDRKVVDFALLDEGGEVRLLIELDDRTHFADRDAARDRMTARAGYRTLRVDGRLARDAVLLRTAIEGAL